MKNTFKARDQRGMENPVPQLPAATAADSGKVPVADSTGYTLADPTSLIPAATGTVAGLVKMAEGVADSEAEDVATLVTDFNGLLAVLRTAGVLGPAPEPEPEPGDGEGDA